MSNALTPILEKLELSDKERVFLLTACGLERPTINDIIKKSELKKPTAYKVMENLVNKHLLQRSADTYRAPLIPPSPERLLEYAKRKTRLAKKVEVEIENSLEVLKKMIGSRAVMPEIRIVYGKDGYTEILEKTLEKSNTEVKFIGDLDDIYHVIDKEYDLKRYIPERVKKNITAKAILARTPIAFEFQKRDKQDRRQTKLFPEHYKPKSFMELWEHSTLIFSGSMEGVALYIESPLITGFYHDLFDLLWERLE